jgi:hypothetical protein
VAEDRLIHNKKLQNALEIINKEIKNHWQSLIHDIYLIYNINNGENNGFWITL